MQAHSAPLPLSSAQDYAKQRSAFEAHLKELSQFYEQEYQPQAAATDKPLACFERALQQEFPTTPPLQHLIHNKIRQLRQALGLMDSLVALQKAVLVPKKTHRALYEAGREVWLEGSGLAQHLFEQSIRSPDPVLRHFSFHYAQLPAFSNSLKLATLALSVSDPQQVLIHINALSASTKRMRALMDGSYTPAPETSRLMRGFTGALSILAGLALAGLAFCLIIALTPAGIGLLPALPLAALSGCLIGEGIVRISSACQTPKPSTPVLTPAQQALANSGRDTADALEKFASLRKLSLFPESKSGSAMKKEPVRTFAYPK